MPLTVVYDVAPLKVSLFAWVRYYVPEDV
ncbi:hypothetical protein A2U01_0088665, partial [Trifolium medium]|nr:hypothetical protein [Trifolium medium]